MGGGVDKTDWGINEYRIKIRGKKSYFLVFRNFIDIDVMNGYVVYCKWNDNIPSLEFRRRIVTAYVTNSS